MTTFSFDDVMLLKLGQDERSLVREGTPRGLVLGLVPPAVHVKRTHGEL
jgi:hypothetical protein